MPPTAAITPRKAVALAAAIAASVLVVAGVAFQLPMIAVIGALVLAFMLLAAVFFLHRQMSATRELATALQFELRELGHQYRQDTSHQETKAAIEDMRAELGAGLRKSMRAINACMRESSAINASFDTYMRESSAAGTSLLGIGRANAQSIEDLRLERQRDLSMLVEKLSLHNTTLATLESSIHRVIHESGELARQNTSDLAKTLVHQAVEQQTTERQATATEIGKALDKLGRTGSNRYDELQKCIDRDGRRLKALVEASRKEIVANSRTLIQQARTGIVQEVEALEQLRRLLGPRTVTPLLGGWAMDPVAMLNLVRHVLERQPDCIVELGGGTSTVWLGLALQQIGGGKLISYDHLEEYAEKTRSSINRMGLQEYCEVRCAPLTTTNVDGIEYSWYGIEADRSLGPIDLLLVDGPPANTGPLARLPAVPRLISRLSPRAMVVLDDIGRPDEEKISQYWLQQHPSLRAGEPLGSRTGTFVLEQPRQ